MQNGQKHTEPSPAIVSSSSLVINNPTTRTSMPLESSSSQLDLVQSTTPSSAPPVCTAPPPLPAHAPPILARPRIISANTIPDAILNNQHLNQDLTVLPVNYNFEIHKTIWRIQKAHAQRIALQMPEGLLMYSCTIADILKKYAGVVDVVVLGDVTYGACCVDDFTAVALGCDFLVHYGHSCLVPVQDCSIPMLYIFVDIKFDTSHLLASLQQQFQPHQRLALVATIQFVSTLHAMRTSIQAHFNNIFLPQCRPLSPGELLGCTAPSLLDNADALVYIADGRFHLEAAMIANPSLPAYRYDPYSKSFTQEFYDHPTMLNMRKLSIQRALSASTFGLVLGTLGRQGSLKVFDRTKALLDKNQKQYLILLLSEITPQKLQRMENSVDAWIQIACPRLSIDWGMAFSKPFLTPYEAAVALGQIEWQDDAYPMDYYAKHGGSWTNYYKPSS